MGLTTDCQRDRRWCVRQGNKGRGSKGAQKALKKVGRARQNSVKSVLRPSTHRGIPTSSVQRGRPRRIEWMDKQQRVTRCIGVLCVRCGVVLDVCVWADKRCSIRGWQELKRAGGVGWPGALPVAREYIKRAAQGLAVWQESLKRLACSKPRQAGQAEAQPSRQLSSS